MLCDLKDELQHRLSGPVAKFQDRQLPEPTTLAGYVALLDATVYGFPWRERKRSVWVFRVRRFNQRFENLNGCTLHSVAEQELLRARKTRQRRIQP